MLPARARRRTTRRPRTVCARGRTTRLALDDASAKADLVNLLLSTSAPARRIAIAALAAKYGEDLGYDPDAGPEERGAAAARWQE